MPGKAQHEPAISIDYRRHLANMIEQIMVTECHFCPLFIEGVSFREISIACFLFWFSILFSHVGKFGEDQSSTF